MENTNSLFEQITKIIHSLEHENLTEERKFILQPLIDIIQKKVDDKNEIRLNFICTHNSRRSHLSQIWAQTAAYYYNIKNIYCYSGGTEATAVFPEVVKTLTQQGFQIKSIADVKNPIYGIKYSDNAAPIIGFSKTFDSDFNPKTDFTAILTCSSADQGCPYISGAEARMPIKYDDPKAFDNTPLQSSKYKERSIQIASEMFYVFSKIKMESCL